MIRAATIDDAQEIARVHVASWRTTYVGQMPQTVLDDLSVPQRHIMWARQLEDPSQRILVAERDGEVVGFASVGPSRDEDRSPRTAEMFTIYLTEENKGNGIGTALWARSLEILTELGYSEVTLWVLDSNERARRFYERMGLEFDGTQKSLHLGDKPLTELRYRARIQ